MTLTPGSHVGPYQIEALLGAGGMGEVYRALDTRLHRRVALKALRADEGLQSEQRQTRFLQEARAASALQHPHIISIYDVVATDGRLFIVMELISGDTLDRIIPKHGLRVIEALRIAVEILDALVTAHAAGIIHRDLKPSNVMVDEHGAAKLLDFGLAKLREHSANVGETATLTEVFDNKPRTEPGMVIGTASYMSPEQAEARPVDARSDIFSFGSLLYEMLTGRRAFSGGSTAATISAILRDDPMPPSSVCPDLPPELERVVLRCLRKEPHRRWQHASDLRVVLQELREESESGTLATTRPTPTKVRSRTGVLAGFAGAVALMLLAAVWAVTTKKTPAPTLRALPLTSFAGEEGGPSFSPDGNQIAFDWNGPNKDNFDIYVKLIGSGEPLRLTTDPADDYQPAWSPDGRQIAFLRRVSPESAAVMLIPALGGGERKLTEIKTPSVRRLELPTVREIAPKLAWSPDGEWLLTTVAVFIRDGRLVAISTTTGEVRELNLPREIPTTWGDWSPDFSPDGRMLSFGRIRTAARAGVYVVPLSAALSPTGSLKLIVSDDFSNGQPVWTADGRSIVFRSTRTGSSTLWRIPSDGSHDAEQLSVGDASSPALSRRGDRLAFIRPTQDFNIWRTSLTEDGGAAAAVPVVVSTALDGNPDVSPDGKRIVFASDRSGSIEIWIAQSDGSHPVQLTNFRRYSGSPQWSPDGTHIVFDSNASGRFQVHIVSADGGVAQQLTRGPNESAIPRWSRDGESIYFSQVAATPEIWKMRADGSDLQQVTRNGGRAARESPDGKWLYFMKTDSPEPIWRMPVAGGPESVVVDRPVIRRAFGVGSRGIYFTALDGTQPTIYFFDLSTGRTRQLISLSKPPGLGFALSRDEKSILFTQLDESRANIMVVDNFR